MAALPPLERGGLRWAPHIAGLAVSAATLLLWGAAAERTDLARPALLGLGLLSAATITGALFWARRACRTCEHVLVSQSAAQTLSDANDRLREIDRLKDEFLAMVSHDLRSPLASTQSAVENLLDEIDDPLTPEQRAYLEIVGRSTARLTRLIDDLIDVARIEAGVFSIEAREIDLRDPVRAAVEEVRPLAEDRALRLALDLPETPVPLRGDEDRLHQAVSNLLGNAVRHARSEVRVRVGLDGADGASARATILLVEDDADLATALRGRLVYEGYEVRCAASVAEARAALRAERPDLALLDLMLPDGEGIDLLREIRADEGLRGLPVIVQTNRSARHEVEKGFTTGANAYLGKPTDSARLLAVIERLLAEAHAGRI